MSEYGPWRHGDVGDDDKFAYASLTSAYCGTLERPRGKLAIKEDQSPRSSFAVCYCRKELLPVIAI